MKKLNVKNKIGVFKNNILSDIYFLLGWFLATIGFKSSAKNTLIKSLDHKANRSLKIFDKLKTGKNDAIKLISKLKNEAKLNNTVLYNLLSVSNDLSSIYTILGDYEMSNKNYNAANLFYKEAIIYSNNHSESNDLDILITKTAVDNNLIVSQLAINYYPMLEKWLVYFKKHDLKNLLIIALDPIVYKKVSDLGLQVYHLPIFAFQKNVKNILWYETVKFRQRIINSGVNYLHSDLDAFWLKNPYNFVTNLSGDIVSSIGYGTPRELVKNWGFVACLGFYYMKSNQNTRLFYNDYLKYTKRNKHDQDGLNTLLFENNIIWEDNNEYYLTGVSKSKKIEVSLIKDDIITRDASVFIKSTPNVFHPPLSGSDIFEKITMLEKFGFKF